MEMQHFVLWLNRLGSTHVISLFLANIFKKFLKDQIVKEDAQKLSPICQLARCITKMG